jgi:hypothetical protein
MKVVVETRNGERAGHRIWLTMRQQLRVGRSDWAEFSVPDDPAMADVQFALECGGRGCQLRNLAGDTPVFVNGRRVEQQTLVNGDLIRAGDTEFLVSIQLGRDAISSAVPLATRRRATGLQAIRYASIGDGNIACFSGLRSDCPEDEIARILQSEHAMYVVVHRECADEETMRSLTSQPVALLRHPGELPENASAAAEEEAASPEVVLVGPTSSADRFDLIRSSWSRNAITVFFTGREAAGAQALLDERPFLSLKPLELSERLTNSNLRLTADAFEGLAALLLPIGDTHWGVFASPKFRPAWERIGLPDPPENERSAWSRPDTFWMSGSRPDDDVNAVEVGKTIAVG